MRRRVLLLIVTLAGASGSEAYADPGIEFFEKKIRPILAEACYSCHSVEAKKQKGGLLLDSKDALLKGGESGPALVPGKVKESLITKAVRYDDLELRMPPKGKLSAEKIADLEKWVAMAAPECRTGGAKVSGKYMDVEEGRKFWAFQPPRSPPLPEVKDTAWPVKDLDRLILGKLEAKGLKPAKDADRATLLLRLYFVLLGLPPTPEEIDQFVEDKSPEAVSKAVDRLLASPHFGERWGRHWLDVARFAESSGGGQSLLFPDAWRYRDYVIRAFNSDMPYTQFIREQIAGDLLPVKNPDDRYWQMVATAFLLLGPTNFERQDKPLLEMDVIDEQIDTMGKAFLGMTIGCARCHDHKFDPIPTKDYYALAGIFKSTKFIVHSNVSKWMERPLPLPSDKELAIQKHEAVVAALKQEIKLAKAKEPKVVDSGDAPIKGNPVAAKDLPGIVIDDVQATKVGSWKHSTYNNNFIGQGYLFDDRAMKGEKTVTFQPEFTRSGLYEVRLAYTHSTNRADKVAVHVFHTGGDDTVYVNQKKRPPIDGRFVSLGTFRFAKGDQWFVMVTTDGANGHVIADAVQFLSEDDVKQLGSKEEVKDPQPKKDSAAPKGKTLAQLEAELKRLEKLAPERPTAMAVGEGDKIDDFYVCIRGNVHNKGEKAPRGFLQVASLSKSPVLTKKESGRRELADWLTSPDNTLSARVMVNRVWHHLMGAGIVRTMDNFGHTGELPSHPELLDHLAVRFMQEGWSIKKLIREIVLSRTFAMSSETNAEGAKADPENRLLWRMNRRRLDAESLRDTILSVSGQLDPTLYGNNVKKGTTAERNYVFEDTRRSIYAPVFRNRLLELFEVFDFPDPNIVVGKRNVSTVPTQALYLMNNAFVMAQARHTAAATLKAAGLDDAKRIELAYRKSLGRLPTPRERELALAYVTAATTNEARTAAWERFYQTLFACVDFRYVN